MRRQTRTRPVLATCGLTTRIRVEGPLVFASREGISFTVYRSNCGVQMTNPSKRDSAARKVVAAARAIVTYQIGLPVGCQRLQRALSWLSPYESNLPTLCDEYMEAVVGLPLSTDRLEWDRESLSQKDITLESANRRFRDRIFETCWSLIDRFDRAERHATPLT
jgi:hypothetical protein